MKEIKSWKSYCIDWKTAEEKTNKKQVRKGIKKNRLKEFYWKRWGSKKRTFDSRMIDVPSERKK